MPLPLLPFPPTCSLSPDPSTPHTSRQGATRHVASCAWPFAEHVVEGHPCCRARRLPSLSWLRDALAQADPQRGGLRVVPASWPLWPKPPHNIPVQASVWTPLCLSLEWNCWVIR